MLNISFLLVHRNRNYCNAQNKIKLLEYKEFLFAANQGFGLAASITILAAL